MAHIEIPLTSEEVAQQTYQEYIANPNQFIRRMIPQLERDNPQFLDGSLSGAVTVTLEEHPYPAQRILGGSFFRYACSDRQMQKSGKKLPNPALSFNRTLKEVIMLTEGAHKAGSGIGAVARQMAMRLERDDPEIGRIVRDLVELPIAIFMTKSIDAFVQGVYKTHLNLSFVDTEDVLPEPVEIEPKSSILPLVGRSIVRAGLLEMVLDPINFTVETMLEVGKRAPGIVSRVRRIVNGDLPNPDIYLLTASFELFCFMKEFQHRGEQFPIIREEQINHPDPEIDKIIQTGKDDARFGEMLAEYRTRIFQEIESTNPNLYWGIERILFPLSTMGDEVFSHAVNGIINQYSTLFNIKSKFKLI